MKRAFLVFLCLRMIAYSQQKTDVNAWQNAASYLKQAMNTEAAPCDDFYKHVCGNYDQNNKKMFEKDMDKILMKAVLAINLWRNDTPEYQRVTKVFFDKCASVEKDTKWMKRLYDAIAKRIGELPLFAKLKQADNSAGNASAFDPWLLMGVAQRQLDERIVLEASVDFVEIDFQTKPQLQLEPVLPPDDGVNPGASLNVTDMRLLIFELAENIGLDKSKIEPVVDEWITEVRDFYIDWQNVSFVIGDGDRLPLSNLSIELPSFNWESYLKGLLPEDVRQHLESNKTHEIYIDNIDLVEELGQLFTRHSEDAIKSFVFLRAFYTMEDRYFGEIGEAYKQLSVIAKTPKDRCLEYALRHLAPAMARIYFDAIGANIDQWRYDVNLLGRNIISAFTFLLNSVDWVDAEDKEKIQAKLDNIKFNCGIPSWIGDDQKVMDRTIMFNANLDLFENEYLSSQTMFDRDAQRLLPDEDGQITEDEVEPDPSFLKNAEYDPESNEINMFLGQVVPPHYNVSYPLPVKYGGLGTILAHEIMHAFDSNNIYSGAFKNRSNIRTMTQKPARLRRQVVQEDLKKESYKAFEKKKSCLVQQYSKVCFDGGACVSGERTVAENMADIDGIKVAYTAYKIVTQVLGSEPVIPEIIQYSNDQLFFLAFARNWCSNEPVNWSKLQDEHTPDKARVDQGLKNVALFAQAFKCPAGSRYAPADRCTLWGDLKEPASRRK